MVRANQEYERKASQAFVLERPGLIQRWRERRALKRMGRS